MRPETDKPETWLAAVAVTLLFAVFMTALAASLLLTVPEARPDDMGWAEPVILAPALLVLVWKDMTERRLPDLVTLPLLLAGLAFAASSMEITTLFSSVAGASAGYLLISVIRTGFRRIRGKDGIGLGDAKLISAAGAWFGIFGLGPLLLIASTAGLVFILIVRLVSSSASSTDTAYPFGPAIACAFWCLWWGQVLFPYT